MGRLKQLREEFEQLGKEIEEDILRLCSKRTAKYSQIPEAHVCLELTIPQGRSCRLQIIILTDQVDDGRQQ
ncbi:hypothetical protein [Burkholderia multivorans]|uniref:hypothetical protein n=1 Tax=Burkholderia multivorans TaxID=87883 RepID=UPI001C22FB8D|nr:hypothetical protein [Burkholderia multivorans]MBU9477974.1 hypothetical protein [Burkholderia multivorans]